jgi:hypothetical protein
MTAAIALREDFDGSALRELAKRTGDANQSRRLLALAEIYYAGSRGQAARIGGVGLQTIRDWVLRFNARGPEAMVALISQTVAQGAHAVLLMDQAGWHSSAKLEVPDNITIVLFPPRSPELYPVENVWQFLLDNWLSNRVFTSYDDIIDHCCEAWNKLVDRPLDDHVHRHARLGPWVTIIGTWY